MVGGSNCESLTPTRGSDLHLPGNPQPLVTPDTDFSNISWNWLCYESAFSAVYQKYLWKLTLFADAILLQTWLYTHMPSLVWIVWKTNEILHIVGSMLQYSIVNLFKLRSWLILKKKLHIFQKNNNENINKCLDKVSKSFASYFFKD